MPDGSPPEDDALFAWMARERDGRWSQIAATIPNAPPGLDTGPAVLTFRSKQLAMRLRSLAQAHGAATGQVVQLRVYRFERIMVIDA